VSSSEIVVIASPRVKALQQHGAVARPMPESKFLPQQGLAATLACGSLQQSSFLTDAFELSQGRAW
jgi:hypothetical protein